MSRYLILGGTYFLGKHTVSLFAKTGDDLLLANRGNAGNIFPEYPNVRQIVCDREDPASFEALPEEHFDAVIDFCGYREGDVRHFIDHFPGSFSQYIFISTVDVYARGSNRPYKEEDPTETRDLGGEAGQYILGKATLEKELKECCRRIGAEWTVLRPSVIFGPDNYAPRENLYFTMIKTRGRILSPADSDGSFQMVYVKDVAKAIRKAANNCEFYSKTINITSGEQFTYPKFEALLEAICDVSFERIPVPAADVIANNLPLPFPLTKAESAEYDNHLSETLGITYTDISTAMKETYDAFCEEEKNEKTSKQ